MNKILFSLIRLAVCLSSRPWPRQAVRFSQRTATNQIAHFQRRQFGSHPKELMNFWRSNPIAGRSALCNTWRRLDGEEKMMAPPTSSNQARLSYCLDQLSFGQRRFATCDVEIRVAVRSVYSFQSRGMENRYQSNRGDRWIRRRMLELLIALHDDVSQPSKFRSRGKIFIQNRGSPGRRGPDHDEPFRDQGTDWRRPSGIPCLTSHLVRRRLRK